MMKKNNQNLENQITGLLKKASKGNYKPDLLQRFVRKAQRQNTKLAPWIWLGTGFSTGIAAVFMYIMFINFEVSYQPNEMIVNQQAYQTISLDLMQENNLIKVTVNSQNDMFGVSMKLTLDDGLILRNDFLNQKQVEWEVDLLKGENELLLPLEVINNSTTVHKVYIELNGDDFERKILLNLNNNKLTKPI